MNRTAVVVPVIALGALLSAHFQGALPAFFSNKTASQTLAEYGAMCAAAIASVPDFNCLDGDTIPITVNGVQPSQYTPEMNCDWPALLQLGEQGQCIPYSRVLNFSSGTNQIVATCRQKVIRSENSVLFDEIDIISHNVADGSTCWFQATSSDPNDPLDGSKVPSPTSASPSPGYPDPAVFWQSPPQVAKQDCGGCHDNDPFMYSPYIGQVWDKVPTDPFGWYKHLGPDFAQWPTVSLSTPNNPCVGCHRMGIQHTSNLGTKQATGLVAIENADSWAQQYPQTHWMPPDNFHSKAQWQTIYQQPVADLIACNQTPTLPNCILNPIPSLP